MDNRDKIGSIEIVRPSSMVFVCKKCHTGGNNLINIEDVDYSNFYVHCVACDTYYRMVNNYKFVVNSKGQIQYHPDFMEKEIPKKELLDLIMNKNINCEIFEI